MHLTDLFCKDVSHPYKQPSCIFVLFVLVKWALVVAICFHVALFSIQQLIWRLSFEYIPYTEYLSVGWPRRNIRRVNVHVIRSDNKSTVCETAFKLFGQAVSCSHTHDLYNEPIDAPVWWRRVNVTRPSLRHGELQANNQSAKTLVNGRIEKRELSWWESVRGVAGVGNPLNNSWRIFVPIELVSFGYRVRVMKTVHVSFSKQLLELKAAWV